MQPTAQTATQPDIEPDGCCGCRAPDATARVITPDRSALMCALCVITLVGTVEGTRIAVLLDVAPASR